MEIIEVKEEHYPVVQQIAYNTWPQTFKDILSEQQIKYMLEMMYSTEAIKLQINKLGHKYILIKDEDEYLGYLSYQINYKPEITKIHKIYVLPNIQGKGVGKILIQKAELIAKENNSKKLSLNVNRNNKAIQFYEHMGFYIEGSENIDIGEGFLMEDYVMNKDIYS